MGDSSKVRSSEVQGVVHKVGDAEIQVARQDGVVIYSVRGTCSGELLEVLEKQVHRCHQDAGLDFRGLRDPSPDMLPVLRRLNRRFTRKQRVLLLYDPPSRLMDLLKLTGADRDFHVYKAEGGLTTRAEPEPETQEALPPKKSKSDSIVHFAHDLDRTQELETSLEVAGRRTGRMFQKWEPNFPPYDIATLYLPHDKVGGDFFQLLPLDGDSLGVMVGDVSGHGLEAALLMGMARKVMELRAAEGSTEDPLETLCKVNADLYTDLDRFTFITAFYGILDRDSGRFRYGRAGHNYPIHLSRKTNTVSELPGTGIAFGIDNGPLFKQTLKLHETHLEPGDVLLLYTDGLTEAAHSRRGQLGVERLMHLLEQQDANLSAEDLKQNLLEELNTFLDEQPLMDDLTLILIKRNT